MGNFTFEEMNLMCIYNTGSRTGLIDSLREMRGELAPEETELRELTDSALGKLQAMSDAEFADKSIKIGGIKGFCKAMNIVADETLDSKLYAQKEWFIENSGLSVL